MKRKQMRFLTAAVLLRMYWILPSAQACSCDNFEKDANKLLEESDAAFLGEVIRDDIFFPYEYVVRVFEVWKGDVCKQQTLHNFAGCQAELFEGETYLIFARRVSGVLNYEDDLVISRCAPILPLSHNSQASLFYTLTDSEDLLSELGPGEEPLPKALCGATGVLLCFLMFSGLLLLQLRVRHRFMLSFITGSTGLPYAYPQTGSMAC